LCKKTSFQRSDWTSELAAVLLAGTSATAAATGSGVWSAEADLAIASDASMRVKVPSKNICRTIIFAAVFLIWR
jgi:hypothetical protein